MVVGLKMFAVISVIVAGFLFGRVAAHSTSGNLDFIIENIYDGDTVTITFKNVPPILGDHLGIRLLGIDTPEMKDTNVCIRNMAKISRDTLVEFLASGKTVVLTNLKRDKYFRLDGDFLVDGKSAVQHMLDKKRAKVYTGEGAKPVWECDMSWFKK